MKHKKAIIIAALVVGGGIAFAAYRRRKSTAYIAGDGNVVIGSVECTGGDCDGAPASQSWLSGASPDHFLDFDLPQWMR